MGGQRKVTGAGIAETTERAMREAARVYVRFVWPVVLFCALVPDISYAANAERATGLFYRITHLHPVLYVVLFLIFVASVLNLFLQGWVSPNFLLLSRLAERFGLMDRGLFGLPRPSTGKRTKPEDRDAGPRPSTNTQAKEGAYVRRVDQAVQSTGKSQMPTPLNGVNHAIPRFVYGPGSQTGVPRIVESKPDKKPSTHDFRFSAAVEMPPAEELGRREKEQLVVSGTVKGPDGLGLGSVMVYLADDTGNRVGQSSRSTSDTGEFKVLINQPGRYVLNAYKRGYVTENSDPVVLPLESGKIEGLTVKMIPEGCVVHGRVLNETDGAGMANVQVKCGCRTGDFTRATRTDAAGDFRVTGIPVNSECHLEVLGADGRELVRSRAFQTVQKRELRQDLVVPSRLLGDRRRPPDKVPGKRTRSKADKTADVRPEQPPDANTATH